MLAKSIAATMVPFLVALIAFFVFLPSDRAGTLVTSGPIQPLNPYRVLDTRQTYMMQPGDVIPVTTRLPGGATGASVNITITEPQAHGYLTVWDGRSPRPTASIINVTSPDETVANFAIVPLNEDGTFHLYASMPTHVVVDVMGFVAGPNYGWTQPFVWGDGSVLIAMGKGWEVLDGRANLQTAISIIDSCHGATLYHGDFDSVGFIAAHRTACGSKGFGGIERMQYGERILLRLPDGRERTYELFWHLDGVPLNNEGKPIPLGTSIVLQTSQDASHVYLRYFRLV